MRAIAIGVIVIALLWFLYYSEFNTMQFGQYKVHRTTVDPEGSAAMFAELDRRIGVLERHLSDKYGCGDGLGGQCNRGAQLVNPRTDHELFTDIIKKYNMHDRMTQLLENYNGARFSEISPNNVLGNTSFTEGKGRKIVMCLRNKAGQLHDVNTIMFVTLHEITHVMNDQWGHELYFWGLFRIVLQEAVECGIYEPVDYARRPKAYCGIMITQNPLYL